MNIVQLSVSGSVLLVTVWLLRLLLKYRLPRTTFTALWTVVVLRLLLPIRFVSPVSIWNMTWKQKQQFQILRPVAVSEGVPVQELHAQADTIQFVDSDISVFTWLWLIGVLLMAAYFAVGYICSLRKFRRAIPISTELIGVAVPDIGLRSVRFRITEEKNAPLTYGIFRPVVLLPTDAVQNKEKLSYILLHEFTHIQRLDCLLKLLLTAALCLHWWNPLVWCFVRLAERDIEIACDEVVLRKLNGKQRRSYALMLLDMQALQTGTSVLCSSFGKNATEERIYAMTKHRKTTKITILAAIAVTLVTVSVFATQPSPEEKAEDLSIEIEHGICETAIDNTQMPSLDREEEHPMSKGVSKWTSPLAGELNVASSFGTKIHPVFGVEAFHDGVDLIADEGTEILAVRAGTVTEAGFDAAKGYYLVIDHGDGYESRYQHCKEILAVQGDAVEQGSVIAHVGATGWATGAHLHISVSSDEIFVDPLEMIIE